MRKQQKIEQQQNINHIPKVCKMIYPKCPTVLKYRLF